MKKVITYGTFDLFHYGHLRLLRRARALGDYLIAAVSSDDFNRLKGKECVHNLSARIENLRAIRYVDEVIVEENWEQKREDIQRHEVDVFVMGDDWQGKFDFLSDICKVVYLERTPDISSTELKKICGHPTG